MAIDYSHPDFISRYQPRKSYAYSRAEASGKPTRQHCDFCDSCYTLGCDGSTARHHFIHLYKGDEESERLLSRAGYPKYADWHSGV